MALIPLAAILHIKKVGAIPVEDEQSLRLLRLANQ